MTHTLVPTPFGNGNRKANDRFHVTESEGLEACCHCGRPVGADPLYAEVTDGGSRYVTDRETVDPEADASVTGYMGLFAVGSSKCAKVLRDNGVRVQKLDAFRAADPFHVP